MTTLKALLDDLIKNGTGAIYLEKDCSDYEIEAAKKMGRHVVRKDGIGLVRLTEHWLDYQLLVDRIEIGKGEYCIIAYTAGSEAIDAHDKPDLDEITRQTCYFCEFDCPHAGRVILACREFFKLRPQR